MRTRGQVRKRGPGSGGVQFPAPPAEFFRRLRRLSRLKDRWSFRCSAPALANFIHSPRRVPACTRILRLPPFGRSPSRHDSHCSIHCREDIESPHARPSERVVASDVFALHRPHSAAHHGPVAQSAEAPDSESGSCRFESCVDHFQRVGSSTAFRTPPRLGGGPGSTPGRRMNSWPLAVGSWQ